MSRPVISVEGLSKAYRIGAEEEVPDTLVGAAKGVLSAPWKNFQRLRRLNTSLVDSSRDAPDNDVLWALRDVSFEIAQGDVVGIIGRNGAGKSTLLKVLSRITQPTDGRAVIRGRVSSLLEVGTGFHPELTGRENVYMNGTILGMTKSEIDRKFDEIVDFSGVGKFLDTPCKRYSSGMQVRLAFAVAAHLEPEVLIIDEVLAVGDVAFQNKCIGKMRQTATAGKTVLFVSHNLSAISELCSRVITMSGGRVIVDGGVDEGINSYTELAPQAHQSFSIEEATHPVIKSISLGDKECTGTFMEGQDLLIAMEIHNPNEAFDAGFGISVETPSLTRVFACCSLDHEKPIQCDRGITRVAFRARNPLIPGKYCVTLALHKFANGKTIDRKDQAIGFEVISSKEMVGKRTRSGLIQVDGDWMST